jgi:hypothetical protein
MKGLCSLLYTLIGLMFIITIINCAPYAYHKSPSRASYESYRVRIYNEKGVYQGYEEHTKYRTRYYKMTDHGHVYRGYSK